MKKRKKKKVEGEAGPSRKRKRPSQKGNENVSAEISFSSDSEDLDLNQASLKDLIGKIQKPRDTDFVDGEKIADDPPNLKEATSSWKEAKAKITVAPKRGLGVGDSLAAME